MPKTYSQKGFAKASILLQSLHEAKILQLSDGCIEGPHAWQKYALALHDVLGCFDHMARLAQPFEHVGHGTRVTEPVVYERNAHRRILSFRRSDPSLRLLHKRMPSTSQHSGSQSSSGVGKPPFVKLGDGNAELLRDEFVILKAKLFAIVRGIQ